MWNSRFSVLRTSATTARSRGKTKTAGCSLTRRPLSEGVRLHHFTLGIPCRRPLGTGRGCHLEPPTHLWGFLLTCWVPGPPLRSHSLVPCSVEKGLSFTFPFRRPSPPPARRCEALRGPPACGRAAGRPWVEGPRAHSLALRCWRPSSAGLRSAHVRRAGRTRSFRVPCTCLLGPVLGPPHLGPRACLRGRRFQGGTLLMTDHWVTWAAVPAHALCTGWQ